MRSKSETARLKLYTKQCHLQVTESGRITYILCWCRRKTMLNQSINLICLAA